VTNSEFLSSLLGLIDFMAHRFGESTPTNEVVRQVGEALFGGNAATAFSAIRSGADNPVLMSALEKTQQHLERALSRPRSEAKHLLFLSKFFR
jgi:hypothetical protein